MVFKDITTVIQCGANPSTLQRNITYVIEDVNGNDMLAPISMRENVPPTTSACTGNPVQTGASCTINTEYAPNVISEFTDVLSAGCPSSPSDSPCGFTFANQQWQWCPSLSSPTSMGTIGKDTVDNTLITIDGNDLGFAPGTIFQK